MSYSLLPTIRYSVEHGVGINKCPYFLILHFGLNVFFSFYVKILCILSAAHTYIGRYTYIYTLMCIQYIGLLYMFEIKGYLHSETKGFNMKLVDPLL